MLTTKIGIDENDPTCNLQEELGFCCCGCPEDNLRYILGGLELITREREEGTNFHAWYQEWRQDRLAHFGNEPAVEFFFYWTDKEGYTEHGGCFPGWLTDKGKELLASLQAWKAQIESKAQEV